MLDWRAIAFRSREWQTILPVAILLIAFRSAVFMFWPQSHFDSDQAVFGLMAKHLAELRAFPVFMYGQTYILAVEAWLAAPVFLIAGASVAALKFPLLIINLVLALLLLRLCWREVGLTPPFALVATLFIVLPAPGTAAQLVAPSGGNVEPFLYIVLIWLTRNRPNWCGMILGVGFLQREFTIYGLAALLMIEGARGVLFTRDGVVRRLRMFRTAAEVWLVVNLLKQYSSAAGPGTSLADLYQTPPNNLREMLNRICIDPRTMLSGIWSGVTVHLPRLFGVAVEPLSDYSIDSLVNQGLFGGRVLLAVIGVIAIVRIATRIGRERQWREEYDPCAYLVLVGVFSFGANTILRCGITGVMRYDLLSLIGATGLAAWYLRTESYRPLAALWIALVIGWAAITGSAHVRLLAEYVSHAPVGAKRTIIRHLELRDIRYASSDYWLAYYISFLTNERIVVDSTDVVRIAEYRRIVNAHRDVAIRISRTPCPDGREVMRGVYFCGP
jgi:hypothetical protein